MHVRGMCVRALALHIPERGYFPSNSQAQPNTLQLSNAMVVNLFM